MRAWILLVVLAGCMATPGPTTVHWAVTNDSPQHVSYTILLEGGAIVHEKHGSLQPGQHRGHTMMANGADLTATVRLLDGTGAARLGSFADPLCDHHHLLATWNGTWSLEWQGAECQ